MKGSSTSAVWDGKNKPHREDREWVRGWSPQQIAKRLPVEFPDDPTMRISHEAIYQALYVPARGGLTRQPKFASKMRWAHRAPTSGHMAFGIFTVLVGCLVLLTGVGARTPALGIIGFTIMGAGAYLATKRFGSPKIRRRPNSSQSMGPVELG